MPSRVHGVVLVSRVNMPAIQALAFARATRPSSLVALHVATPRSDVESLVAEWDRLEIPIPLTILDSPYRDLTRPALQFINDIRRASPRDLVCVFVPEYVVSHWWEALLHNQSALRLKSRLLFARGVVVVSVPWQLAHQAADQPEDEAGRSLRAPM